MKTFAQRFEERRGVLDNGAYVQSKAAEVFNGTKLLLREARDASRGRTVPDAVVIVKVEDVL